MPSYFFRLRVALFFYMCLHPCILGSSRQRTQGGDVENVAGFVDNDAWPGNPCCQPEKLLLSVVVGSTCAHDYSMCNSSLTVQQLIQNNRRMQRGG